MLSLAWKPLGGKAACVSLNYRYQSASHYKLMIKLAWCASAGERRVGVHYCQRRAAGAAGDNKESRHRGLSLRVYRNGLRHLGLCVQALHTMHA